ncbi:hypothetical protein, partial [Brevibacillus porteri]|uniref:hypothetical protein n=1 Tax=Brevibacillus porteri TaxID=2126350 RepID=UPI003D1E5859
EETGEISEDLRDTYGDAMQKAKYALKRPPLKHILKGPLWTQFRFLHGVVQSISQGVALESERFLLFPPHHDSNVQNRYTLHKKTDAIAGHLLPIYQIEKMRYSCPYAILSLESDRTSWPHQCKGFFAP